MRDLYIIKSNFIDPKENQATLIKEKYATELNAFSYENLVRAKA